MWAESFSARRLTTAALLLFPLTLAAQDERHISSPDGRLEFRMFIDQPNDGDFPQLAYRVSFRGKPLLNTSYMGLDIYNQEPILGANLGVTASKTSNGSGYRSLTVDYIQNGSLGRRINVEVRAYNDGIAFRYVIPKSTPLEEIVIHEEGTGFAFAHDAAFSRTPPNTRFDLPFIAEQPGAGPVAIADVAIAHFPRSYLIHVDGPSLILRLVPLPDKPNVAFEGATPLTLPWRLLIIGFDKEHINQSEVWRDLNH